MGSVYKLKTKKKKVYAKKENKRKILKFDVILARRFIIKRRKVNFT